MQTLRDRVAVITGAGSGIGAALAHACADAGMRVVVADIEKDAAEAVAKALRARDAEAVALPVDVADRDSVARLAAMTWAAFGACHLLCNNAGVSVLKPLLASGADDWSWVLSVNLMGAVHGVAAFAPRLIEQRETAHIVNVASMAGLLPLPGFGVYAASKYAVVGFSEVLQQELAPHGIGVSIVCPGMVATRIQDSARNRPGGGTAEAPPADADPNFPAELAAVIAPEQVAATILTAVRDNALYVPTHAAWARPFAQRSRAVLDAFAGLEAGAGSVPITSSM